MFNERRQYHMLASLLALSLVACSQAETKAHEPVPTPTPTPTILRVPTETATPEPPRTITIKIGGDVMLGRTVLAESRNHGNLSWPFEHIDLSDADITIVNLESPLTSDCQQLDLSTMIFCSPIESAQVLATAGVDAVNLANNHILDQSVKGYNETLKALQDAGVLPVDENHLAIITKDNIRIGVMGINRIRQTAEYTILTPQQIAEKVTTARKQVDILIVCLHDGQEYNHSYTDDQQNIAQTAIDAGADIVAGTHPHVIEPTVNYRDHLIFFSLGNLIFDQKGSDVNTGLVVILFFQGNQLTNYQIQQVDIIHNQPQLSP